MFYQRLLIQLIVCKVSNKALEMVIQRRFWSKTLSMFSVTFAVAGRPEHSTFKFVARLSRRQMKVLSFCKQHPNWL